MPAEPGYFKMIHRLKNLIALLILYILISGLYSIENINVSRSDGIYTVEAGFFVDAPIAIVWEVLTDYENINHFLSNILLSEKIEGATGTVIKQIGVYRLLKFISVKGEITLEIDEVRFSTISFRDISKLDFYLYEGSWRLEERENGIVVHYHLRANPKSINFSAITGRVLSNLTVSTIDDIKKEIVKRKNQDNMK